MYAVCNIDAEIIDVHHELAEAHTQCKHLNGKIKFKLVPIYTVHVVERIVLNNEPILEAE